MLTVFKMIPLALVWVLAITGIEALPMKQLPEMQMVHRAVLDQNGNYVMLWTPRDNDIVFEVQVATKGYVGLGFSPSGGMRDADIILGWVNDPDGEVYLHDRFATGFQMPVIDEIQDVELLGGYQNDTHTTLRFSRAWDTCDGAQDLILSEDTVRVIWAYGEQDPINENNMRIHSQRGSKSLYLNEPRFVLPEFSEDVKTWELLAPNVSLPNDLDTLYWCKLYKIPEITRKVQLIGYMPIVQEGNFEHVHHIVLYECDLENSERYYEKWLDVQGAQCRSANMPVSWNHCRVPIIAWAIGSDGEMYPDHVGFPLGEQHGGASYFMMEMHYDNPNLRQDVIDSSGLALFYTENVRTNDAGFVVIGSSVSPNMIIPAGQEWKTIGFCTSNCTEKSLPQDGINVFQGLMHAHLLGRSMKLRQIRDGKELPTIFEDKTYDFNYQQSRVLKEDMKILPGDSFIFECGYDSRGIKMPTFGGFGTTEEMCLAFLAYYPRSSLEMCASAPTLENIYKTLGVEEIYGDKNDPMDVLGGNKIDEEKETELATKLKQGGESPEISELKMSQLFKAVVAKSPQEYKNMTLYDILHSQDTWNQDIVSRFQDMVLNTPMTSICLTDTGITAAETAFPDFVALEAEASACNVDLGGNTGNTGVIDQQTGVGSGVGTAGASPQLPNMDLMHRVPLDQLGEYIMLWTPDQDKITIEVQAATNGYVGLGFSPNGGMTGSDIILGWVDDATGETFLHDRYATGYMVPKIDDAQDVTLLGGYQNDTHTVLRFTRPWNTCDQGEDMELSGDTVRMIWSYGTEDPVGNDPMGLRIHSQRGTKSMYLKEPQFVLPEFGNDVKSWEVRSPDVKLPNDLTTLYWCKIFKMPPLPRKTHVIGYVPIISDDNILHVHHILLYECHIAESERHFEKFLNIDGAQCFGANMPPSWRLCSSPLVAWAIGGEGDIFPEHVGFPLGEEHGGATYFMMEMHYDNPNLRQGVVDNSGLRIFYTENLRQYDAGILMLGHDVSPTMMIPPGQNWLTIGHCSGSCTNDALPQDGVKVFAGVLHAHLLGANITLRQIRDNKELDIPIKDLNYDFNFQETRVLKDELNILPGDSFITECGYDSTKRPVPTFGGFGTKEEMCLTFLFYYPRVDLAMCSSAPTMASLFQALGIEEIYKNRKGPSASEDGAGNGIDEEAEAKLVDAILNNNGESDLKEIDLVQLLRGVIIKAPLKYQNQSLYDVVVSQETWNNEEVVKSLQDIVINGEHTVRCDTKKDTKEEVKNEALQEKISYPNFEPLPPPENSCSRGEQGLNELICPPQLPSCNRFRWPNNVLGNRPSFF